MGDAKQMLFARNLISICVDSNENADFQGNVWHQYSDDPISFKSVTNMLTMVDSLMDEWDFPQKGLEQREFVSTERPRHQRVDVADEELVIDKVQKRHGTRNIQNKKGKLGTFIVQIAFRQNATWQGNVVVVDTNDKKTFSSAMELIRIMSDSLKGD
ncbi:hypothetical protein [Butyrivibrio sp. INlla14]|uniref:hypothetical protein n=1 Tax=Butyrivibrio sp. INlla14 TaxID=1520808 RepID=UPI000877297D|nr:hypothetical protein [Butyrivibrio sp. INlla14]SCY05238.1 hypothetical protein SAMN02910371_00897 [Butyrivibrio sp. INlla14]